MKTFLTICLILLSGCTTAQRMAYYAPECKERGYVENTDAFRNCMIQLEAIDTNAAFGAINAKPRVCTNLGGIWSCS